MAALVHTFNDDHKKIRWQEQYVSEGLNKKASAESHGIVRGFELAPQAPPSATQFVLQTDVAKGDGVICLRNADNRVVTLLQSAPITVDMALVADGTYWICAWTDYSIGATTNAEIYLLTTAELSNPLYSGKIVVIGWVNKNGALISTHPAAGTPNLGVSDYSLTTGGSPAAMRQIARNYESKGRIDWQKMIRFGRADEYMGLHLLGNNLVQEWKQTTPAFLAAPPLTNGYMTVDDTDPSPPSGDLHFVVNAKSDTAGVPTTLILAHKMLTHVQGGDIIRFSFQYKVPANLAAGNWTLGYGIMYLDKDGNMIPVAGAISALAAIGVGGALTAWTKLENEVHVIGGRNIVYALPYVTIIHTDNTGADVFFYFDDFEMEVLRGAGPQINPSVDANEHVMQPVNASILRLRDWSWNAFPVPTKLDIVDWEVEVGTIGAAAGVVGNGRSMLVRRKNGPATPPHPLFEATGFMGIKGGFGPFGGNTRHRKALFEQNTPRAWATLRWNGVVLAVVDGYGIASVASLGVGYYRITLDTDEDGNPWLQDLDYSVSLGTLHGSPIAATGRMVEVVAKGVVPNTFDIIYRFDTGVGGQWAPNDPAIPGDEIYVQVFAAD
jgi:hypothetical protein